MARSQSDNSPKLLQGTLNMMVLRVLADGAEHGYGIARRIRQRSAEALLIEEGSLYPALHRMEKSGLISSQWGPSESNRNAKYYQLTAKGKKHLAREAESWSQMVAAIGNVMAGLS